MKQGHVHVGGERTFHSCKDTHEKEMNTTQQSTNQLTTELKEPPPPYLLQYSILFSASGIYSYLHLLNASERVAAETEIQNSSRHIPFQFATK